VFGYRCPGAEFSNDFVECHAALRRSRRQSDCAQVEVSGFAFPRAALCETKYRLLQPIAIGGTVHLRSRPSGNDYPASLVTRERILDDLSVIRRTFTANHETDPIRFLSNPAVAIFGRYDDRHAVDQ
jgi:hypothetical protein